MAMPIREHASTMKEALNISVNTITWLSDFSRIISGQSGDSTMEKGTNWTVVEIGLCTGLTAWTAITEADLATDAVKCLTY